MKKLDWPLGVTISTSLTLLAAMLVAPAVRAATENYSGQYNYLSLGNDVARADYQRWLDLGVNIAGRSGVLRDGSGDSAEGIQAGIDYAFTHDGLGNTTTSGRGINNVTCPTGRYASSLPIYFDNPVNRATWSTNGHANGDGTTGRGAYGAGTTYAINDVVVYRGIPWVSLAGSNTGHTPATGIGDPTWWTPYYGDPSTDFSFASTFKGQASLSAGGNYSPGCQIFFTFNNSWGFITGAANGGTVENVEAIGQFAHGSPEGAKVRCGLPIGGVGIAVPGGSGGPNRTKLVNVGAQNFYKGIATSFNSIDALGAENKIYDPFVNNACVGLQFINLQNYINYMQGGTICGQTSVSMRVQSQGLLVNGGNYSCPGQGAGAKFPMTPSSTIFQGGGQQILLTTTLTIGSDTYMWKTCATQDECTRNTYNAWTVVTSHFGIVPFQLTSFNVSTGAATFLSITAWEQVRNNVGSQELLDEINAATSIYAAEMFTVFSGSGLTANAVHIESTTGASAVPTRLINSYVSYGGNRLNTFNEVYFNYDPSQYPSLVSDAGLANFYAQQTFDFITMDSVDLTINGWNVPAAGGLYDFLNLTGNEALRFTVHNNNPVRLNHRALSYYISNGYPFSSEKYAYQQAPGLGYGYFDYHAPSVTISNGTMANPTPSVNNWTTTPSVGFRPAPWGSPCVAPSQYVDLLSPPAITNTGPSAAPTFVSGTYNSTTGYVQLTITGGAAQYHSNFTLSSAAGTGSFASLNGTWRADYGDGTNLWFYAGTGLTLTITGATIAYKDYVYTVPYPLVYGSIQYKICDWQMLFAAYAGGTTYVKGDLVTSSSVKYISLVNSNTGNTPVSSPTQWAAFHFGFLSAHFSWSLGQDLTTTNTPGLNWSARGKSFTVYVSDASGKVPPSIFPGLAIVLTGTGGSGCPMTAATFIVTGVHRNLGYIDVINKVNSQFAYNPWGQGNQCTGTTVGQQAFSFTALN